MSLTAPHRLLWDALLLPLPQARDAWQTWRATTDLDRLDNASFHLLPSLAGRMTEWLADDPQQAILLGICRRAWSQNQLRRKLLADALEALRAAGIEPVAATGPILWAALYWPAGAIRPIGMVDLLVEPALARRVFEVLSAAGWEASSGMPKATGNQFHFAPAAVMQGPSGGQLRLHWRVLRRTDLSLRRPAFPPLEALPQDQVAPYAPPLEYSLVAALGGMHEDGIDWHYDALIICRQPGIPWETVAALVRWRCKERERLVELRRAWGADIPLAVTKIPRTRVPERILAMALQGYRSAKSTLVDILGGA